MSPDAACYARGTPPRPSPAPPTCSPGSAASSSPHDFPPYGRVRPHPDKSPTTPGPATSSPHNSETRGASAGKETSAAHPGIKKMAENIAVAAVTPAAREPGDIAAPPARRKEHPGPKE